jgi:medium-chain acyl-[acyl-carrier-protein] hydrolase
MNMSSWVAERPSAYRKLRLFCFCYAGGSAADFSSWRSFLPPEISVCAIQLPGRGARYAETPYDSMPELIAALAPALAHMDEPYAFFGHSMGGLVAFELTRHRMRNGLSMPRHLFISGCHAAHCRNNDKPLHNLPTNAFIDELRDYNGTPAEVLENRELMELLLPTLRADFALVENYQYQPAPRLPVPITVFAGKNDEHDSDEQVEGWRTETSSAFRVQWFDGDHFFINSHRQEVLASINAELTRLFDRQYA